MTNRKPGLTPIFALIGLGAAVLSLGGCAAVVTPVVMGVAMQAVHETQTLAVQSAKEGTDLAVGSVLASGKAALAEAAQARELALAARQTQQVAAVLAPAPPAPPAPIRPAATTSTQPPTLTVKAPAITPSARLVQAYADAQMVP